MLKKTLAVNRLANTNACFCFLAGYWLASFEVLCNSVGPAFNLTYIT